MKNQPWTGNQVQQNVGLPVYPNKPFWYMHHPNTCWEFLMYKDRWLFLPTFRRLWEWAGVNNVKLIPRGGTDSTMARVKMMDNGFQILDLEMGYQTRFPTKFGGYYYASVWESPKVLGNKVIWNQDKEGYNDWREELLTDGVIAPPDTDILEFFVDMQEKRVSRNEGKNLTPRVQKMYEFEVTKLDYMRKYIQQGGPVYLDGKEPKPKKGKRSV